MDFINKVYLSLKKIEPVLNSWYFEGVAKFLALAYLLKQVV